MKASLQNGALLLIAALATFRGMSPLALAEDAVYAKDEKAVVAEAVRSIPYLKEFQQLFPAATVHMGFPASVIFTKENEHEVMQQFYIGAHVGLYSRYELTMTVVFKMTPDQKRITSFEEPCFRVQEVGPITVSPNDQAHISYGRADDFDYAKFKLLKAHGGDFASIGLKLTKDSPVPNFEREWKPER